MTDNTLTKQASLSQTAAIQMGIRIAAIILVVTALAYWHTYRTVSELEQRHLVDHVTERGNFENERFRLVADSQAALRRTLLSRLGSAGAEPLIKQNLDTAFNRLYEAWPDGTVRSRRGAEFDGKAFGFIGKNVALSTELKQRILLYHALSDQFGAAWHHRIQNLYFTTPENVLIGYWPDVPDWAHSLPGDFSIPEQEYAWVATPEQNPLRTTIWTGLFYDIGSDQWMVSAQTPVDMDGQHVATIGNDVLLNQLIENTLHNNIAGTYNLIFRGDGRLIAHPDKLDVIADHQGFFDITQSNDGYLKAIYSAITQNPNSPTITVNHNGQREYLASYFFAGPDWHLVTVMPQELVTGPAFAMARYILLLGAISLILEIAVLIWVLNRKVTQPLHSLSVAVDKIADNNFDVELDTNRNDELGGIATAFKAMATNLQLRQQKDAEINTRLEQEVEDRTAALSAAKYEAEYANKQKTEFLGRMSHELRTPMNAILGFGQLLEKQALDIDQTIFLNEIMNAAKHLKLLIDEVLELSVLESGKLNLQFSCFDISGCIAESISIVQKSADEKNITIDFYPDEDEEYYVHADHTRLKEVILNLLTNAIKYTWNGGIVSIKCRPEKHFVRVTFVDNGIGIAKEKQRHIFDPFFRACENIEEIEGTGIGLAIAKKYIRLMKGDIGFISEPGIGSEFWFDCPLATELDRQEDQRKTTELRHTLINKTYKILYVEDNESNLRLIQYLFKYNPKIQLIHARNGYDGITLAKKEYPDLILLDINLPDINGYQVLEILNDNSSTRVIPKLALSASALPRDIEKGIKAGFLHYVTKPINTDEFQALIDEVLSTFDSKNEIPMQPNKQNNNLGQDHF